MITMRPLSNRMDDKTVSDRMDALERRIAKLESHLQPMGDLCPKCRAFGFQVQSHVLRTAHGGQRLHMMKCRFCGFAEEKMGG